MYFIIVIGLTLVLPIGATAAELITAHPAAFLPIVLGKWMVFFACGVRLFLAGLRQTFTPKFTLKEIFEIDSDEPLQIVQELGFANLSMGLLGLLALIHPVLTFSGAVTGGLYYGLAGVKHINTPGRNAKRGLAMVTDFIVFAACLVYVWYTFDVFLPAYAR
jgi:hypothetical protein